MKKESRLLQKLKKFYFDNAALKYILILSIFVFSIGYLLVGAITGVQVSSEADTDYRDFQEVSNGYSVGMTYKGYNPKIKTLQVNLLLQSQDADGNAFPKLEFKTKLLHSQPHVKTEIINAGNNSYVILFKNLQPKFGAALIKVSTSSVVDTDEDTVNVTKSATPDEIQETDANKKTDTGTVNVYVNETDNLIDKKLKKKNQKQYWIETIQKQISYLKQNQKDIEKQIDSLVSQNKNNQNQLKNIKKSQKYQTKDENKAQNQNNSDLKNSIQNNDKTIHQLESVLIERQKQQKLLNEEISDINANKYKPQ